MYLTADFKTLRSAYIEVKAFLEKEAYAPDLSLKTTIEHDLGCAGDDSLLLMEKFVRHYKLDTTNFDYERHFSYEEDISNSWSALILLLWLPFWLLFLGLRLISFGKINLRLPEGDPDPESKKLDLTFGDMVIWYLKGRFCLRQDVLVRIKRW